MRKPFMGAPVLTLGFRSNGSTEHPAIITRVWSDDRVNLTIFGDNAQKPESYTSIKFVQTRDQAVRAKELGGPFGIVAFWNDAESEPALLDLTGGPLKGFAFLQDMPVDPKPLEVVLAPSKFTMTPQEAPAVDVEALAARARELASESTPA